MNTDSAKEREPVMIDTNIEQNAGNGQANASQLRPPADSANGSHAAAVSVDELGEWIESFEYVIRSGGAARAHFLLDELLRYAHQRGMALPFSANTPYVNTIPRFRQPAFPGRREIERRIKSIIRWNAMAMVVRANKASDNIGGHISSFASGATLIEVAQNHFLRGPEAPGGGDIVYFQGHSAPGMYARAYLEGRLSERQLENFRRELGRDGGLSSYPHPWLMPNFWFSPSVSMGLTPIMSIYQARFNRYLHDRRLHDTSAQKVWAFLGDGEMDEPESLGSITLAAREKLDNLIWVINCNLQRLDGPVRGNGKIIQELEAAFRGAGWNVIKVIWGEDWDPLLAQDTEGVLVRRMNETVDGQYQKYTVASGDYIRQDFFGADPRLLDMVKNHSDEQLRKLRRGGHDPEKVYAAYQAAVQHRGAPTVLLAQTIKGYGLGESGEGKNITHQQKKLNEDELATFRTRFGIPISDDQVAKAPFYRPPEDSEEMQYLHRQRRALGGYVPHREPSAPPLPAPPGELFEEFYAGTDGRAVSTTMVFVRILSKLLRDKDLGKLLVPIVPDEARTFGMEALFRQVGIYSSLGQLYDPVDRENLLYYREATDGQVLEEGITEAGSFSSFIAAGTAYATHGINTIPFYIFYSMFGFPARGRPDLGGRRHARQGVFPRRHRRAHHPERRGAAAPGWPQSRRRARHSQPQSVRSRLRLRACGDHPRRHRPHVHPAGEPVLLPDSDERELRHAGDAERRRGGYPARHLPAGAVARGPRQTARPPARQRHHPERGAGRARVAARLRRGGRRVERYQLQGAVQRPQRGGAVERAASRRAAAELPAAGVRRRARRVRGGVRLSEGAAARPGAASAGAAGGAGHRRLRAQRDARGAARLLPGRLPPHRRVRTQRPRRDR